MSAGEIVARFEINDGTTVEEAEAALEEMVTLAPESCSVLTYVGTRQVPGEYDLLDYRTDPST